MLGCVLEDSTAGWCGEELEVKERIEEGSFSSSVPPAGGSTSSSEAASTEFSPLTAGRWEEKDSRQDSTTIHEEENPEKK